MTSLPLANNGHPLGEQLLVAGGDTQTTAEWGRGSWVWITHAFLKESTELPLVLWNTAAAAKLPILPKPVTAQSLTVDLVQWLFPDTLYLPLTVPLGRRIQDNRMQTAFRRSSASNSVGQGQIFTCCRKLHHLRYTSRSKRVTSSGENRNPWCPPWKMALCTARASH